MRPPPLAMLALLQPACQPQGGDSGLEKARVSDAVQVVPSDGIPATLPLQEANNNLDVLDVDGTVFLAWRTAPTHFASEMATIHVVSSTDEATWSTETSVSIGTDVREPRLAWLQEPRRLFLYFAVLGADPAAFEPQGTMYVFRERDGTWSDPAWLREDTFVPWRVKPHQNHPELMGYTGGGEIYQQDELPQLDVEWLKSLDGIAWEPVVEGVATVHTGGASETDFLYQTDGSLVAVARNEAGDEGGFGSLVCTADDRSLASWECVHDPKKYDSPLLIGYAGRSWLIARRNLTGTGDYDLGLGDLSHEEQALAYEAAYWGAPKRCSLWQVFPEDKSIAFDLDLPSRGDTCFPSALDRGEGHFTVYNYSNDIEGEDLPWNQGQVAPTFIYRQEVWLP